MIFPRVRNERKPNCHPLDFISAPPAFIKKLNSYEGWVYDARDVRLECWVECSPMCQIIWMKDNKTLDFSKTQRYYVKNVQHLPNLGADDFESIQSVLVWNLTAWPSGQLDRIADNNVNFTCLSTSNGIGPGVSSSTNFGVLCKHNHLYIYICICIYTLHTSKKHV